METGHLVNTFIAVFPDQGLRLFHQLQVFPETFKTLRKNQEGRFNFRVCIQQPAFFKQSPQGPLLSKVRHYRVPDAIPLYFPGRKRTKITFDHHFHDPFTGAFYNPLVVIGLRIHGGKTTAFLPAARRELGIIKNKLAIQKARLPLRRR